MATGGAQGGQVGLRMALVLAAQCVRKSDVLDQSQCGQFPVRQNRRCFELAQGVDDRAGNVVERLARPVPRLNRPEMPG